MLVEAEKTLASINADMEAADAAEEKIDAIGAVTIHSANKIKAARTAYDALSGLSVKMLGSEGILLQSPPLSVGWWRGT